jgi:hypothetical protein
MPTRHLDRENRDPDSYWIENNAAFTCPCCNGIFIVSGHLHTHGRHCPRDGCGRSYAYVEGGKDSGGKAVINWPVMKDAAD